MQTDSETHNRNRPDPSTERPAVTSDDATVSVVIPVYNAAASLRHCLEALAHSTARPLECIVVDDGSTDGSSAVAESCGAKWLVTEGRTGPAHARNLGAQEARGSLLFFIDADVCVRPDAIARLLADFRTDATLDAVIGSYDDAPEAQNYLSQYRNLMHSFVHQTASQTASTFWSGCGAIRRDVFRAHGGFDESYRRPAIEDIELGARMIRSGHRIMLDRSVQATHLKRWTFWTMLKTDVFDRGIPWTQLVLRERRMPNDLNLKMSQRVSVALAFLAVAAGAAATVRFGATFIAPVMSGLVLLLSGYWMHDIVRMPARGAWLVMVVMFAAAALFAAASGEWMLIPALVLASTILYVRSRYEEQPGRVRRTSGVLSGILAIGFAAYSLSLLPSSALAAVFLLIVLLVALINHRFYRFIARRRGIPSAVAAVPLHLLHFLHNGLAFLAGIVGYAGRCAIGRSYGDARASSVRARSNASMKKAS